MRDSVRRVAGLSWGKAGEGGDLREGRGEGRTYDQEHEILKNLLEVAVAWDSDGAVHEGADEGPDEARHGLRPATQHLQTEGHAVDVGAVVRDDA